MKTNVEVLEKQERELTVCDSCGREVDDDGQTCECDFCSVCAPSYTDPDVPEDVLTVSEWKSNETFDGYSMSDDYGLAIASNVLLGIVATIGWVWLAIIVEPTFLFMGVCTGTVAAIGLWLSTHLQLYGLKTKYVEHFEDRGDQR